MLSQTGHKQSDGLFSKAIVSFFLVCSLFISLRAILIEGRYSSSMGEYVFSAIPEILELILAVWMMSLFFRNRKEIRMQRFDYLIIGYMLLNIVLGCILSADVKLSLYGFRQTYLPMFFYFFARVGLNSNTEVQSKVLERINTWFAIVGVAGLLLYFLFPGFSSFMIIRAGGVINYYYILRMGSIFWTPVVFSAFMCAFGLYNFILFLRNGGIKTHVILLVFEVCLFLSVSRGGIISYLIGVVILTIAYKQYKKSLLNIGVLTVILVFIFGILLKDHFKTVGFIFHSTKDLLGQSFKQNEHSGINRLQLWINSLSIFVAHPMGLGLGRAGHVAVRFAKEYKENISVYSTDGWYLKLANETGVIGLVSYAVIFWMSFKMLYKTRVKGNEPMFFWILFVAVATQNIVSNVLDFYLFAQFYWLVIGLAVNYSQKYHAVE